MKIKSNFDSSLLLCNGIVKIWSGDHALFEMRLPILRDKYEEKDFDSFVGFCASPLEVINKQLQTSFKSRMDLWLFYKNNGDTKFIKTLLKFFAKYMINFEYVDDCLMWNKRKIPRQVFELFCTYFAIAWGVKDLKELNYIITDDMDEFDKQRILMEQKIAKTKQQGTREGAQGPGFDRILLGVSREFHYSFQEIYNMTIYAIYLMYSQLNAIMVYDINNIAAGNGNLKKNTKYTHWVDRKDR